MEKVAIIVRSDGIEYDDRVRKVSLSLSHNYDVAIYVVEDANEERIGYTSYGIKYHSLCLKTRKLFPSGKLLFLKTLEIYIRLRSVVRECDHIWACEETMFVFPLLNHKGSTIWDLHEIPAWFCQGILKRVFHVIEKRARKLVHANPQRLNYLISEGVALLPEKHDFIHNYPDASFIESDLKPNIFNDFKQWLNNSRYVYLQGLGSQDRYPYNSIISVLQATDLKVFVAGRVSDDIKMSIKKEDPSADVRVYYAGMINQLEIPVILKDAAYSIVLYKISKPNNRYCEANRFYQAICLGVPVIAGKNESMADIVEKGYGIALKSDGADLSELVAANKKMLDNIDIYKEKCIKDRNSYIWSDKMVKLYV